MKSYTCDALIIGGGGAALRAAIAAKETAPTLRVMVATKGELGKSGVTAIACSDRMAFHATLPYTEPGTADSWKIHADDVYRIGGCVSDWDLAELHGKHSGAAFEYLSRLGVPFVRREDGHADQFITDGSEYARACYTGPRTANRIEEALVRKVRAMDIPVIEHTMIADLILAEDRSRVIGAFGIERNEAKSGNAAPLMIRAKTIVLGTGGAGNAFKVHVFPPGMDGSGYAMAYRAGAELVNMEFIQIGLSSTKTQLACSGSMMRALPRFINERGEEFLPKYFPESTPSKEIYHVVFRKGASWPVSNEEPSHVIDVAVFKEMRAGHTVYLDYSKNPAGFDFDDLPKETQARYHSEIKAEISSEERSRSPLHRLREINPASIEWLREHGVDLSAGDRIELAPAIQHFQGGVKIRTRADTTIAGLYAAGEVAGGQHGANRPGGNALMDAQVFGEIAGRVASEEASAVELTPIGADRSAQWSAHLDILGDRTQGLPASQVRSRIQTILSGCASVVRTEKGLTEGLNALAALKAEGIYADEKGWAFALETINMYDVAEMVMRAACMREESRGPHLYFAHPDDAHPMPRNDEAWQRTIVLSKGRDGMRTETGTPMGPEEGM
jgi:succinate dehydrogenase / fumarate reductase flavoprotein subunit